MKRNEVQKAEEYLQKCIVNAQMALKAIEKIRASEERQNNQPQPTINAQIVEGALLSCGFYDAEELKTDSAAGLITFITYKAGKVLMLPEIKKCIKYATKRAKEGKITNKSAYLTTILKDAMQQGAGNA